LGKRRLAVGQSEPHIMLSTPSPGGKRSVGLGTSTGDLSSCRAEAGLDAFQINFHGDRNLDQLLL